NLRLVCCVHENKKTFSFQSVYVKLKLTAAVKSLSGCVLYDQLHCKVTFSLVAIHAELNHPCNRQALPALAPKLLSKGAFSTRALDTLCKY
ncbi:MAG: hypothetical protein K2P35_09655, partial [Lachnospiraceae bacterium]|nr:hypothetical protein [Lachnospiraceae bacterium]